VSEIPSEITLRDMIKIGLVVFLELNIIFSGGIYVLANLKRTPLIEIFQTSWVTYRNCSNEIFTGCNTSYNESHLVSYVYVIARPL
jgi:hypothetical protein